MMIYVVWHPELYLLLFPRVFTIRSSIYKSNREPNGLSHRQVIASRNRKSKTLNLESKFLTRKREILNFKNHILKVEFKI